MKLVIILYFISATAGVAEMQSTSASTLETVKDLGGWGAFLVLVFWLVRDLGKKVDKLVVVSEEILRKNSEDHEKILNTLNDAE